MNEPRGDQIALRMAQLDALVAQLKVYVLEKSYWNASQMCAQVGLREPSIHDALNDLGRALSDNDE